MAQDLLRAVILHTFRVQVGLKGQCLGFELQGAGFWGAGLRD